MKSETQTKENVAYTHTEREMFVCVHMHKKRCKPKTKFQYSVIRSYTEGILIRIRMDIPLLKWLFMSELHNTHKNKTCCINDEKTRSLSRKKNR